MVLIILLSVGVSLFFGRRLVLCQVGKFLLKEMEPEESDIIIILRGDENYSRVLEAANLFKEGLANIVLISSSLLDKPSLRLRELGVDVPTRQEQLVSILIQLGVPKKEITIDNQPPGGGTWGELKRIKKLIKEEGYTRIIIVTSWYHTRRTHVMCNKLFNNDNLIFFIVAAKNDISTPSNWWKYRYEALYTFEELPKLFFFYLNRIFGIAFKDDPALN